MSLGGALAYSSLILTSSIHTAHHLRNIVVTELGTVHPACVMIILFLTEIKDNMQTTGNSVAYCDPNLQPHLPVRALMGRSWSACKISPLAVTGVHGLEV